MPGPSCARAGPKSNMAGRVIYPGLNRCAPVANSPVGPASQSRWRKLKSSTPRSRAFLTSRKLHRRRFTVERAVRAVKRDGDRVTYLDGVAAVQCRVTGSNVSFQRRATLVVASRDLRVDRPVVGRERLVTRRPRMDRTVW